MSLGVIKEWLCVDHGEFEASHPICPAPGCDSSAVTREFRTAPGSISRSTRQFDAGIRKSSDMYRINNFRSAKPGEAAHGGTAARDNGMPTGVLWGDECRKVLGRGFSELVGVANKPFHGLEHNNALRSFANEPDSAGAYQKMRARPQAGEIRVPTRVEISADGRSNSKAVAESLK